MLGRLVALEIIVSIPAAVELCILLYSVYTRRRKSSLNTDRTQCSESTKTYKTQYYLEHVSSCIYAGVLQQQAASIGSSAAAL